MATDPTDLDRLDAQARDVLAANGIHFTGTDGPTAHEVLALAAELRALRAENERLRTAAANCLRAQSEAASAFGRDDHDFKLAAEDGANLALRLALGEHARGGA